MAGKSAQYPLFDRVCTIFCVLETPDRVLGCVESVCPDLDVKVDKGSKGWKAITLTHSKSTLVLNKTTFVGPGFKGAAGVFNKVTLGAGTFFRDVRVRPTTIREKLLMHISRTEMLVGCVATPELSDEVGHYELVFAIARAMDGVIFDGQGMLDGKGKLVMDQHGRHDLQVWKSAR